MRKEMHGARGGVLHSCKVVQEGGPWTCNMCTRTHHPQCLLGSDTDHFWHWSLKRNMLALWSSYLNKNIFTSAANLTVMADLWIIFDEDIVNLLRGGGRAKHPLPPPSHVTTNQCIYSDKSKFDECFSVSIEAQFLKHFDLCIASLNWTIFSQSEKEFLHAICKSLPKIKCRG